MKIQTKITLFLAGVFSFVPEVYAHVGYVEPGLGFSLSDNVDIEFFTRVLSDPSNIGLLVLVGFLTIAVWSVLSRAVAVQQWSTTLKHRLLSYYDLVPWVLRLCVGTALIGAGLANVLISPLLPGFDYLAWVEMLAGFFLVVGFAIIPTVILSAALFIAALSRSMYVVGNIEFLALVVAIVLVNDGRPGLDHLLGIRWSVYTDKFRKYVPTVLRFGVGIAMVFLALYEKVLNPANAALVVTDFNMQHAIPVSVEMWVLGTALVELLLGLCFIIGYKVRPFAMLAILVLTASFFFFREAVYSHITLFGALSVLCVLGGGPLSVDKKD